MCSLSSTDRQLALQGETVPYVICTRLGEDGQPEASTSDKSLSDRAYHVEELRSNPRLAADPEYYLSSQVMALWCAADADYAGSLLLHRGQLMSARDEAVMSLVINLSSLVQPGLQGYTGKP